MVFETITGYNGETTRDTAEHEKEPTADEWTSRIQGGLNRLYPRRTSVLTRTGLRRKVPGAKGRGGAGALQVAEVNWEETLLPPIPQPAGRRCLSETSWEDRCLPPMGTAACVPGRLSEASWEDRVLPTLVPTKLRHSDELSWEDRCLPSLSTVGVAASLPSPSSRMSELKWEDRLLP